MRYLLAATLLVASCGGDRSGVLEIADAWAGSTPPNAPAGAFYLAIDNGLSHAVTIESVTSDRCESIEIHVSNIDDQNVMRMRPASDAARTIAPGDTLEMEPGAMHVMCIGMVEPFVEGEQFDYSVSFSDSTVIDGKVTVENR